MPGKENAQNMEERNRKVEEILQAHTAPISSQDVYDAGNCMGLDELFSDESASIREQMEKATILNAMLPNNGQGHSRLLMEGGTKNDKFFCNSEADKRQLVECMVDSAEFYRELEQKYDPKSPRGRFAKLLRRNQEFQMRNDHTDLMQTNFGQSYFTSYNATMMTFPSPLYEKGKDENGKPVFEKDEKRYEEMLGRIPFLDQLEEQQEFFFDQYLPYAQKKEQGTLSAEDVKNFEGQYKEHLEKQEAYFNKIRSIPHTDKDIAENRTFIKNDIKTGFGINWQNERFGNLIMKDVEASREIMGRGWSAEDIALFQNMQMMESRLQALAGVDAKSSANCTPEEREKAKKLLEGMAKPYERMKNAYVTSVDERNKLLNGMEETVKGYSELVIGHQQKNLKKNDFYMPEPMQKCLTDAKNKKVEEFEIGREPEQLNKGFSLKEIGTNIKYLVEDLKAVEMTFGGSKEFKEMKESLLDLQRSAETNLKRGIEEPQVLKTLQDKMARTMQDTKKYLDHKEKQFEEDVNRRDSASKQKREQPRIRMALNMMDKLQFLSERTKAAEQVLNPEQVYMRKDLPKVKEAQKAKLQEKIGAEDGPLKEAKDKSEYLKHVCKVMAYYERTKDSFYKRMTGNMEESFESFQKRVESAGDREFSGKELKEIGQRNGLINKILNEENARWKENGGLSAEQRLSAEDIKKRVDAEIKKEAERIHEKNEQAKQKQSEKQTARYRKSLVSKPREAQGPAAPH